MACVSLLRVNGTLLSGVARDSSVDFVFKSSLMHIDSLASAAVYLVFDLSVEVQVAHQAAAPIMTTVWRCNMSQLVLVDRMQSWVSSRLLLLFAITLSVFAGLLRAPGRCALWMMWWVLDGQIQV